MFAIREIGDWFGIAASLVCIAAGVYLLSWQSESAEANWFETIAHGMGIYFIGKGLFVGPSLALQRRQVVLAEHQARMLDLQTEVIENQAKGYKLTKRDVNVEDED